MLDSWGDVLPMVSRYLGQPRLSAEKPQLDAVMAKLREVQPYIRRISTAGYYLQRAYTTLEMRAFTRPWLLFKSGL